MSERRLVRMSPLDDGLRDGCYYDWIRLYGLSIEAFTWSPFGQFDQIVSNRISNPFTSPLNKVMGPIECRAR